MIDSIYIMLYIVGLILFILGIDKQSITYIGASMIMYLILWVQSVYIEIPFIAVTNATNYTTGNQQHLDPAVGASCWIFIIIDILFIFWYFLVRKEEGDSGDGPALP